MKKFDKMEGVSVRGWLGVAKVSCILCHWGIQLVLAYSWARLAVLVAGKGRGEMFLFLLFLYFQSCSSFFPVPLFHLLYYHFSPFLWETTQNHHFFASVILVTEHRKFLSQCQCAC